MSEIPVISYDEVQPNFLSYSDIHIILKSSIANLSNFRKLLLSNGIVNYSANKENFSKNVSTVNFGLKFASNFINEIYSKGKFELGICTIKIDKKIDINELNQLLSEKAQEIIDFENDSRLRPVHIESNRFIHIKVVYPSVFWGGRRFLNVHLTSYGIAMLEELDGEKTKIDIFIIVKHDRDFTIMRDALRRIFYEKFDPKQIDFNEFQIPINNIQPKILEKTFIELDRNFEALYLTAGTLLRLGEMDSTKLIIHRSQQAIFRRFELEEPHEIIDYAKEENKAFNTISFTFLDKKHSELIYIVSYNFTKYKTTAKFETARIFNDNIDDILYNPETGERSYNKLDDLNEENLDYGDKFSILLRILSILKKNV